MKTLIYYFTGTGNIPAIARNIAQEPGDTELIPIPVEMQHTDVVADAGATRCARPPNLTMEEDTPGERSS
jgi:hypothetical protein